MVNGDSAWRTCRGSRRHPMDTELYLENSEGFEIAVVIGE
jgi:hypothetical protein